ncbi:MAG: hypothetical protein ACP5RP_02750 [Candidatus Micrarchaeia archaeon]
MNRRFLILILAILLFVNVSLVTRLGTVLVFNGDYGLGPKFDANSIYASLFSWSSMNYSGLMTPIGSVIGFILSLLQLPITFFLNAMLVTDIFYFMFLLLGAIGMFLLVLQFTDSFDKRISRLGAFSAALLFSVHYMSALNNLMMPAIFMPYFFLFLYLFIKDLNKGRTNYLFLLSASFALCLFLAFSGSGFIIQDMIILFILFMVLLLYFKGKILLKYSAYIFVIVLLAVSSNISWLYTSYVFSNSPFAVEFFNTNSVRILHLSSSSYVKNMLPFSALNPISAAILILELFAIYYLFIKQDRLKKGFILAMFIAFFTFAILDSTLSFPLGTWFDDLLLFFKYLLVFRYPYSSSHYTFLFFGSFFFGLSIVLFAEGAKRHKLAVPFAFFIAVLLAGYLYYFNYAPIYGLYNIQSNSINQLPFHEIPEYVNNISSYINNNKGNFSVATLPVANTWEITTWYIGENVYSALITVPVYTGGYTAYNEIFFPLSAFQYNDIGNRIGESLITNYSISNMLGFLGIHYIIVQGDAINTSIGDYCYTNFSFSDIYQNLNASQGIRLVKRYGNSLIYENKNYVPLVYAANIRNLSKSFNLITYVNISLLNKIDTVIGNKSFNIQSDIVFSPVLMRFLSDYNAMAVKEIHNFSKPYLSFVQKSPVQFVVSVYNATSPYYMVFRETYDKYWQAYYTNGTEIPETRHIVVNGFANAWYMNKTGNYTIVLYYTFQSTVWLLWAISFVTFGLLVLLIFMLLYAKEKHKNLKNKDNYGK